MRLFIAIVLLANLSSGQISNRFERNFDFENEIDRENMVDSLIRYGLSSIWTKTKNEAVLGVIGEDHQRIKIKLIAITRKTNSPNQYLVIGKSAVKGTICDFSGVITLTAIHKLKQLHFGVDDDYANKGIKSQGVLKAKYEFKEDSTQKHSGTFKGELFSKWYLDAENQVVYDDIEAHADSYMNNAFVGVWKSDTTQKEKICNWGDYRIPKINSDFDIGEGEFAPNKKYQKKGWSTYLKAWAQGNEKAIKIETMEWWK